MRILVVDDRQDDLDLVVAELDRGERSFDVSTAGSLAEARAALELSRFDCLVVDYDLPDGTGDELILDSVMTPVVIVTRDDQVTTNAKLIASGAEDYISKKNLGAENLRRIVEHAIERARFRSELARTNLRLATLVRIDPLTECLNRRAVEADMARILRRSKHDGRTSSAVVFDVDNFKPINDQFGHAAGDQVLREIAATLRREARPGDLLARIGGDEFLLVLPGIGDRVAFRVADRLRQAVREHVVRTGEHEISVSVSVAVGEIPAGVGTATDVFRHLDAALRASKEGGRDRVSSVSPERDAHDREFVSMLEGAGLGVAVQPIVRPSDGKVLRRELLARWPGSSFPNPAALFAKAGELGELARLDRRCVEGAMAWARKEQSGHFHVNVLASTLAHLGERELGDLFAHGDDLTITLELSEPQVLVQPDSLLHALALLREQRVRIAIDDVGLGDSNLEGLVILHPDEIKVDRRWVAGIAESKDKRTGFRAIAELAKVIGALLIAEGVEDSRDAEAITELECDLAQGYFFGRPLLSDGTE